MYAFKGKEEFHTLIDVPVDIHALARELTPPKHFATSTFDSYFPEDRFPSQLVARSSARAFVETCANSVTGNRWLKHFKKRVVGRGFYLDGGFGVGKTHLLAASYHAFTGKKAFLSFQELMFLVGLVRLAGVVAMLSKYDLLVIDEFELDDPANSRIATNMLGQLLDAGVSIITTSNTPPGALGDEKFSGEDFRRELGALTDRFVQLRIDGDDYRITHHLFDDGFSSWTSDEALFDALVASCALSAPRTLSLEFDEMEELLESAHPIRIRLALKNFDAVIIDEFGIFDHPHEALRFVYFVDKLYDNNIKLTVFSRVKISEIFHPTIMKGGDTKKYRRTLSRLIELTSAV
jgi:cell division protein ZapE